MLCWRAFFLNEKMNRTQLLSLGIAMLGIIVLLWGPVFVTSFSFVIYALLAAISFSIYVLLSSRHQKGVKPISSSLYVITTAGLSLLAYHQPSLTRLLQFSWEEYLILLALATICTVASLTLFLAGLQKLSSSKASLVVMVEPVVAAGAVWALLDEKLSVIQCLGATFVLFALFLNARKT